MTKDIGVTVYYDYTLWESSVPLSEQVNLQFYRKRYVIRNTYLPITLTRTESKVRRPIKRYPCSDRMEIKAQNNLIYVKFLSR